MSSVRKKILISAYAISPTKGSEFAVAWNFVLNLAKKYDLWVLYGTSDDHMGDNQTMNNYLKTNRIEHVNFIEVKPGKIANKINSLNKIGLIWMFYLAFNLWQKKVYKIAKKIVEEENIDILHQLVPIGYREPGFLWKIHKPFVWGPIGGTTNRKWALLKKMSKKAIIFYLIKNIINWIQFRFSFRVKKVLNRANSLIAATLNDSDNIQKYYKKNTWHLPENGILSIEIKTEKFANLEELHFVWSGRHDENKNLKMFLEALIPLKDNKKIKIHILGEGALTNILKDFAKEKELENIIIWHGFIDRAKAIEIMANSHLHIITSMGDANTTVLFEAMSYGVPTISLNHCGMKDIICETCGIKINCDSYENAVKELSENLINLANNPDRLITLSKGVMDCAQKHLWENRINMIDKIYTEAENNFYTNQQCAN